MNRGGRCKSCARRTARSAVLAGIAALAAASAGCGARGRSGEQPVPDSYAFPGITGRRCDHTDSRVQDLAFSDIARPGTAGSIALWGLGSAPADTVVVSVRYTGDGELDWVQLLSSNVPTVNAAELLRLLRAALVERWREGAGVRLRMVGGHVDAILPSVVCEAYPVRRLPGVRRPLLTSREYLEYLEARGQRFDVLIRLDDQGRVMDVQLPQPTGYHAIDQYLVEYPRDWEYEPRLHDGIPVATTLRLSIRVGGH